MIRQRIRLPEWAWRATVFYAVDAYYAEEILSFMEELGASDVILSKAEENLTANKYNTGLTYSNANERRSVVVIGLTNSPDEFQDTFDHEKGHLQKHICQADGIDPFGEEAEYLAGAIGKAMFPVAKRFLCEHCRSRLRPQ